MPKQYYTAVRRWLRKPYYDFRRIIEASILGTKTQELIWKTRHLYKGDNWAKGYRGTIDHPHRPLLVKTIESFAPLTKILEIGCNSGPNLYLLAQTFPEVKFYGIDINHKAIEVGRAWMAEAGMNNIELAVGTADDLNHFDDQSIDVAFTDATLLYIGPDKITTVISELVRVARKGLVFVEWHQNATNQNKSSIYCEGHWIHNFNALFQDFVPEDKITVSRLPYDAFGDEGWGTFGSIVRVEL